MEGHHVPEIKSISPKELKEKALFDRSLRILDVRELEEWDICRIPGSIFRPLSLANTWLEEEAGNSALTIVYCHHGIRSAQVCLALTQLGHRNVRNLAGGIAAWQRDVDRAMPTY
ncbi:MAG: rhodanese-like domain-containing protein [Planctomycetota bacterium]|nr:rhodanese-like domain-containing protein [Planctomycetota bacterium]